MTVKSGINHNKNNEQVVKGDYLNKHVNSPLIFIAIGFVIAYLAFPPAILISCLVAVLFWIITFRHFKDLIV